MLRAPIAAWSLLASLAAATPQGSPAPVADESPTSPAAAEQLRWNSFEAWRDRLRAGPEGTRWLEIGWLPEFGLAVERAQEPPRPILLWAMNGHPLGCT